MSLIYPVKVCKANVKGVEKVREELDLIGIEVDEIDSVFCVEEEGSGIAFGIALKYVEKEELLLTEEL